RTPDAELVTRRMRMPAHIDDPAHAGLVLGDHGGVVFHRDGLNERGKMSGGTQRPAEEVVHQVDAMAGDVVQRASAGEGGVEKPVTRAPVGRRPAVRGRLGEYGPSDGPGCEQL